MYFLNWQKLKYTLQVRPFLTRRWGLISTPRLFRTERVSGFRKDRGVFGVCARSAWHIISGSVPQTIIGWKTQGANCIWPLLSLLLVGLVDQTWLARRRSNIGKYFFFSSNPKPKTTPQISPRKTFWKSIWFPPMVLPSLSFSWPDGTQLGWGLLMPLRPKTRPIQVLPAECALV